MAPLPVQIKHAGKVYDVQLDPDLPPAVFKDAVYQVTGIPVDRMKVMVKGGDDSSWKKIGPKAGHTFMVIGAAGELPKPPAKPVVFIEDMDDAELAEALAKPVGLRNLGNTCYMNASVQALRAIPELQIALSAPALQSTTPLPAALRDLYASMSRTTDSITPMAFLSTLRQVNPQFAEMDRREKTRGPSAGYAQQDAEECFGQIINTLRNVPGLPSGSSTVAGAEATATTKKFVEQYLMGEMRRELSCDEAPEEAHSITHENILKIECNITASTNYMLTGILNSLDQKVEKRSPSLGREAVYTQKSRLTRLPGYLVVHMVRFAWRQDIGKKAKIMRKVKFPTEFDALDLVTEELKAKLLPVSRRLKEIEKERRERRKVRKRTKAVATPPPLPLTPHPLAPTPVPSIDVEMGDSVGIQGVDTPAGEETVEPGEPKAKAEGELDEESVYRKKELEELEELVSEDVRNDVGASVSGLYDLVAIVTHKGAAADAGHYIGFVKKSVFHATKSSGPSASGSAPAIASPGVSVPSSGASVLIDEDDEDWYKFDDDKVSLFPREKLATLDGGGEDSSAYVLVYKTKSF
ncbi:Ubiquitin carboxyl-terminal hydrolase 6 [Hypsizygus marmoreus]|uniref:Ubiquitin carboxyl-terminal hydrolase n=1 Tax=Hypsizygus marmoreus TaxID=39966 RepID=A0A369JM88_HYPMA|nr:Ubiquitin carboxyl-terminal hydrolase 6 [Hypsizygus marmoreus]